MSDTQKHELDVGGKKVTLEFGRSLLSETRFSMFASRFASGDDPDPMLLHACYVFAHLVSAKGTNALPLRTNATDDEFWTAFDLVLGSLDEYDGWKAILDTIPTQQLPHEDDPVKKHDDALTDEEATDPN